MVELAENTRVRSLQSLIERVEMSDRFWQFSGKESAGASYLARIDRHPFDCKPPKLDVDFWHFSGKLGGKTIKIEVRGRKSKSRKPL